MISRFGSCGKSIIAVFLVIVLNSNHASAQLCGQLSGVNFAENFNTLASSGSTTLPNSFEFAFNESPGNLTYTADNGSNSAADTYSYGSTGSSDRAFGELTSATVSSTIGACFTNNTDHAITSFLIAYTGEQWRRGVSGGSPDRLDFQFSTDAVSLLSGTYLNVDDLDFASPVVATQGALIGNSATNHTVFSPVAITPSSPIQPEKTFYIRWLPLNISGANDGLAIDDFSIGTALAPGIAGDYNANDVVDAADYVIWRKNLNQAVTIPNDITPGTVVQQDYNEWTQRFGKTASLNSASAATASVSVPEPAALVGLISAAMASIVCRCLPRGVRSY